MGNGTFLLENLKISYIFLFHFRKGKHPKKFVIFWEWNVAALILKDLLYFLIFWEMKPFNPSSKNKNLPRENLLYFTKWKPRKYLLYFPKRKLFFFLGNGNPEKIIHTQKEFSYISGNRN